jgi:hypothetical protein
MPTTRTPIIRFPKAPHITPRAVDLFARMQRCFCTCEPDRDWVHLGRCSGCERWWSLHNELSNELQCRPWESPCILDSDDDDGKPGDPWVRRRQRRQRALEVALRG